MDVPVLKLTLFSVGLRLDLQKLYDPLSKLPKPWPTRFGISVPSLAFLTMIVAFLRVKD